VTLCQAIYPVLTTRPLTQSGNYAIAYE